MAEEGTTIIITDLDISEPALAPQLKHELDIAPASAVKALFAQTAEPSAKTSFSTVLRTIQYGEYSSCPALLLIFDANCQYPGQNRITQAFLTFSFLPLDPSEEEMEAAYPVIVRRAPEIFLGETLSESIARNLNLSLGVTGGNFAQGSAAWSRGSQVERLKATKITSSVRSAKRKLLGTQSRLAILVEENGPQKRGIPHAFSGACIVVLPEGVKGCRMQINVEVELQGVLNKEGLERLVSFWRKSRVDRTPMLEFRLGEEKGVLETWASGEDWTDMKLGDLIMPLDIPKLPEGY